VSVILHGLRLALLAFLLMTIDLRAQTNVSGPWSYTVQQDETAAIVGYAGAEAHIVIPGEIDGYSVARLGRTNTLTSFIGTTGRGATSVSIPASVEVISTYAFRGLTNLTTVTIPGSVKFIGFRAFSGCTNITNVSLENGVGIIGPAVFESSSKLTQVRVPDTVLHIGQAAFDTQVELLPVFSALASEESFYRSLATNTQFIQALATQIRQTAGNYGLATKDDVDSEAVISNAIAQVLQSPQDYHLFTREQYEANRDTGIIEGKAEVTNNPSAYNLYTSSSIMDLRMGGAMVRKQGNAATVVFQPQTTTDLATQPFTNNGTPITNTIPMPGSKGFLRIQAR